MKRDITTNANRRQFLKRALAAGSAAFAVPHIIPASAIGAEGRPAPSQRVVTGYLGVGPRGFLNVREQLTCPDTQVVAVCDVWQHVREKVQAHVNAHYKNNSCQAYVDFRDILARDDIDAVGIASPDHWHVPMAVMAARAGKDVSVEKPLGVSVAEDQLCRQVVKKYNRVFQYGTEARARPACRQAAELVRNGRIGEIREIRVKAPNSSAGGSTKPLPVPNTLDYELWLGPAPWRPYSGCPNNGGSWFHVYDYALGFIAGWGAHPLDLLIWAYDTHLAGTWEVAGTGLIHTKGTNDAVTNWDTRLRFSNGVTMTYWATGVPKDEHPRLAKLGNYAQLIGTEGWIAIYYASMICEPESLSTSVIGPGEIHLPVSAGQERNFIECVKSRETPVSNIDDAVHSDIISHVCDIAIRTGRKLTWDPVKEDFIGDPDASRMLTRARANRGRCSLPAVICIL